MTTSKHSITHDPLTTISNDSFFLSFLVNLIEAFTSEFPLNHEVKFPHYYIHSDACSRYIVPNQIHHYNPFTTGHTLMRG